MSGLGEELQQETSVELRTGCDGRETFGSLCGNVAWEEARRGVSCCLFTSEQEGRGWQNAAAKFG